jgi:hypothetical protein
MVEYVQGWKTTRRQLWLATALLVVLLAVLILPPMASISRYKSRITQLMSESLGRPVRLSSVELRLLPRPGFVLTDLVVEEDPAFGVEPVLRADTVTASIRLMSLWRGRLEISTISVDEASLNMVRTAEGRWNLDPLFRTAAAKAQSKPGAKGEARNPRAALPYLEATHSRINFKSGAEKLPFSLVNTDLSFWLQQPGDWRVRLRGQPARTDVNLDLADTGFVRLEAGAQRAPELRQMPIHLDLEWQEAQLGQLTRLLIGSDPGWRGALTGELHLDGTADAAEIKTRLRATGVHRAEFAPAAPLDFDASCAFLYRYSERALENLVCDSPLGDGRVRVEGGLAGNGGSPQFSVELERIPVDAGLDALRTVRSDFAPGLEAKGSISGKISYAAIAPLAASRDKQSARESRHNSRSTKARQVQAGPLAGSFTVEGFQITGDGLNTPVEASRLVLEPVAIPLPSREDGHPPSSDQPLALETTVALPAGGPTPLAITARLELTGYQVTMHGQASVIRFKELAHLAGIADAVALDALAGEPVTVDLGLEGPWQPPQNAPFTNIAAPVASASATLNEAKATSGEKPRLEAGGSLATDRLHGSIEFHNANWKADFLASHVEIDQATLHVGNGELRWDPVIFSYGPVKGTASLDVPANCAENRPCSTNSPATFNVQFDDLDAGVLQAAILGAHEPGTLLSTLIAQLRPSNSSVAPAWPPLEGTVTVDSLILGPVTLTDAAATLRILSDGAEISSLEADLLGGHVHGGGTLHAAGTDQGKPSYTLEGHFEKLSPAEVGQLLGRDWSGRTFDADGKIDLLGFTDEDLATSAKGRLSFDWRHGAVLTQDSDPSSTAAIPPALARFDRWTGDAEIANGTITLKSNQVQQGSHKLALGAILTLGDPPKLSFSTPRETQARR